MHITTYTAVCISYFIDLYQYQPILNTSSLQYWYWHIDISTRSTWIIQIATHIVVWNVNEVLIKWHAGQYGPILFFCQIWDRYLMSILDRHTLNENYVVPCWENKLCEWFFYAQKAHTPQNHNLKVITMKSKTDVQTLLCTQVKAATDLSLAFQWHKTLQLPQEIFADTSFKSVTQWSFITTQYGGVKYLTSSCSSWI